MGGLPTRGAGARWASRALLLVLFNFTSGAAAMPFVPARPPELGPPADVVASADELTPLVVKFKGGVTRLEVDGAIKSTGGTEVREHPQLRLHVLNVPAVAEEAILAAYAKHPAGGGGEPAHPGASAGSPDGPPYAHQGAPPKISWGRADGVVPTTRAPKI